MSFKRLLFRVISIPFIFIGIAGVIDTLLNLLNPGVTLPWESMVITLLIIGSLFIIGNSLLYMSFDNQDLKVKFYSLFIKIMFIFYLISVLVVLFSTGSFARYGGNEGNSNNIFQTINLVPMKTISEYFILLISKKSINIALGNLIGNILIFAPMGFFLPYFQKKAKIFSVFIVEIAIVIILSEVIQLLTTRGICDIDDVILNLTGAIFIWIICRTNIAKKIFNSLCIDF